MEEIARLSMEEPKKLLGYISMPIYSSLIDILEKDTTKLEMASEKQVEARRKIITNELVKREAFEQGLNIDEIELPFELTKEEIDLAMTLTDMEMAERNKEYALYTTAILSKAYADEVSSSENITIPIIDLPGMSNIVNVFKSEKNPSIKIAAIDALIYCRRPEYDKEIKSILTMVTKDSNPMVAENASMTLKALEELTK